jgi:DNA-binding phage protein
VNTANEITRSYQAQLLKALQDPAEAAAYLDAALEEGSVELFLFALQNVVEARGMHQLVDKSNSNLPNLSDLLSELGLRLAIEVKQPLAFA